MLRKDMSTKTAQSDGDLENKVVLRVENLHKKFCHSLRHSMYYGVIDSVRSMLGAVYATDRLRKNEFWALEDICFELRKGEALGIIGANGSGKSTLLRLITGIFPPDKGRIAFKGRIGALIAVGAGFHPHMTGRENIYLNGTILGMTRREIDEKLDAIIDFADIGDFLEAPISTYSSGMRVRLGFAIAVHCEPDILLVDEVLSVGDLAFRNKSMRKMAELREKANALIFISHNLELVRILCNTIIVVDKGKIVFKGDTHKGIVHYESITRALRSKGADKTASGEYLKRRSSDEIDIVGLQVVPGAGGVSQDIVMGAPLSFFCEFILKKAMDDLYFTILIKNDRNNEILIHKVSDYQKRTFHPDEKYRIGLTIDDPHLVPGVYLVGINIRSRKTYESYENVVFSEYINISSDGDCLERGIVAVEGRWTLEKT